MIARFRSHFRFSDLTLWSFPSLSQNKLPTPDSYTHAHRPLTHVSLPTTTLSLLPTSRTHTSSTHLTHKRKQKREKSLHFFASSSSTSSSSSPSSSTPYRSTFNKHQAHQPDLTDAAPYPYPSPACPSPSQTSDPYSDCDDACRGTNQTSGSRCRTHRDTQLAHLLGGQSIPDAGHRT